MKVVTQVEDNGCVKIDSSQSSSGLNTGWFKPEDVEWKCQFPAFCAWPEMQLGSSVARYF
jgi:hypothetical protein